MSSDQPTDQPTDQPPAEANLFPGDTLQTAIERHGIDLPAEQHAKVDQYAKLLWEWNEKINLTRHTTYDKFVGRDLRDTIEVGKQLHEKEEVLDVGSGGGVPGLLLAVLRPDLTITLTDSVGKKTKVLDSMVEALGLTSTTVYNARSEEMLEDAKYDALTIRAVGSLETMLRWFKPHWRHIGRLLVLKGPKWIEEDKEAKRVGLLRDLHLKVVAEYPMPGTDSNSVLLKIWHHRRHEK
jgi:16S rRNA (guanine527-N7)-methyltransferase